MKPQEVNLHLLNDTKVDIIIEEPEQEEIHQIENNMDCKIPEIILKKLSTSSSENNLFLSLPTGIKKRNELNRSYTDVQKKPHLLSSFTQGMAKKTTSLKYKTLKLINFNKLLHRGKKKPVQQETTFINNYDKRMITCNVSGRKYDILTENLSKHPTTLLGQCAEMKKFYDSENDEYFFDRNNICFDAIIYYFQTDKRLIKPANVPVDIFMDECTFYRLDVEIIDSFKSDIKRKNDAEPILPKNKFMKTVWLLFEYPESSIPARLVALFSMCIIVFSILIFCIETLPRFRNYDIELRKFYSNVTHMLQSSNSSSFNYTDFYIKNSTFMESYREHPYRKPMFIMESFCVAFFTFELVLRFICSPGKFVFWKDIMNIIDFVSLIPYLITLIGMLRNLHSPPAPVSLISLNSTFADFNYNSSTVSTPSSKTQQFAILRVIRLVRVFRIFKLSRHSKGLKILGKTLRASVNELGLLVFFLFIGIILYSSAIYFAEANHKNTQFISIPSAFWWAVVTMTTVGYGDMIPISSLGKVIGSMCAVTGVLTIALPVPVIVSNFNYYYHQEGNSQSTDVHHHVNTCPTYSCKMFKRTK